MNDLIKTIQHIISQSVELKNKYTDELTTPIEFACIFCQSKKEYNEFTQEIEKLGKIVEETPTGFAYFLNESIETNAGHLRLVKIRKPDPKFIQIGDADFNTDYENFKKYQGNSRFELIKREAYEMLRLSDSSFDVMACFSNIPKSRNLGIQL